uniref:CMP/dCMP-type deaminase domain-containing protein n=1 Tax=Trichuris muris TaxID=70415 RepID=A0A5S6QHD6_TRIMR
MVQTHCLFNSLKAALDCQKAAVHSLMRLPRRVVKSAERIDKIIHRPAESNKRKRRLFRAQYLESNDANGKSRNSVLDAKHPPEDAPTIAYDGIKWRNLNPETDGELLETMRSLTNERRNRNRSDILLEGRRLILDAIRCNVDIRHLIFCDPKVLFNFPVSSSFDLLRISRRRMEAWSLLETPPGIMAVAKKPSFKAVSSAQTAGTLPLIVVCDGIKEPNNMGSLIRSLASVGCKFMLTLTGCCDPWNVKVLRAGSSGHFNLPIYENLRLQDVRGYLPAQFTLLLADAHSSGESHSNGGDTHFKIPSIDWTCPVGISSEVPVVLFVGSESNGLSEATLRLAVELNGRRLHIPMAQTGMCLNSSVAAAVRLTCTFVPIGSFGLLPLMTNQWRAVLPDKYRRTELPLREFYFFRTRENRIVSTCVLLCAELFPWERFRHLKRVRTERDETSKRFDILLWPTDRLDELELTNFSEQVANTCTIRVEEILVLKVHVPADQPLTRAQYQWASSVWPVVFHENKRIASLIELTLFSNAEKLEIEKYMTLAIRTAKEANQWVQEVVGCIIVEPKSGVVLAAAHNGLTSSNPLKHAVLAAIDIVAEFHGAPALFEHLPGFSIASVNCLPSERRRQFYLCTGFDCYVTREPCPLCAVALLHSRIRRVFYGHSIENGGFGSKALMHQLDAVNHRFDVIQGVMEAECESLRAPGHVPTETKG